MTRLRLRRGYGRDGLTPARLALVLRYTITGSMEAEARWMLDRLLGV